MRRIVPRAGFLLLGVMEASRLACQFAEDGEVQAH
jgi:hypothetical protein